MTHLQKNQTIRLDAREPMVIVPLSLWRRAEELLEDQEAFASPSHRRRIQKARLDTTRSKLIRPFV